MHMVSCHRQQRKQTRHCSRQTLLSAQHHRSYRNPASVNQSASETPSIPIPIRQGAAARRTRTEASTAVVPMPSPTHGSLREHSFIDQAREQVQQLFKPRPPPWANLGGGTPAHDGGDNGGGGGSPRSDLTVGQPGGPHAFRTAWQRTS